MATLADCLLKEKLATRIVQRFIYGNSLAFPLITRHFHKTNFISLYPKIKIPHLPARLLYTLKDEGVRLPRGDSSTYALTTRIKDSNHITKLCPTAAYVHPQ